MSQAKNWCFTINNYTEDTCDLLAKVNCAYIIYGKEKGESGTPHLQGFISLEKKQKLVWLKKHINETAHWEVARSVKHSIEYCKKEGEVYERGNPPRGQTENGREALKRKYTCILQMAAKGDIEKIKEEYPAEYLRHKKQILSEIAPTTVEPYENTRGIWVYAPSGTGKTKYFQSYEFHDHLPNK
ncbi:MAG: putative viral replication protein [Cressdnaviricota sp.]|nr:MAG: putative viral replication protein [Cressdnaviricota sp.]